MKKKEWQQAHAFDDEDMERIELALSVFGGKIISVTDGHSGGMYERRNQKAKLRAEAKELQAKQRRGHQEAG